MRRSNPQVAFLFVIAIMLFAGLAIYVLSAKANELSHLLIAKSSHDKTESLILDVKDEDFTIYFLGSIPEELKPVEDHIINIGMDPLSEDNMPVYWSEFEYTIYDEEGNVEDSHRRRDYPDNMIIVVNSDYLLDDASIEIIRNCTVDNGVPVFFVGDRNIGLFRNALILNPMTFGENGVMYFEERKTIEGPVLAPDGEKIYSRDLSDAILQYVYHIVGLDNVEEETENGN